MEVFFNTTGISAAYLSAFIQYLLAFCVVIFGVLVLKGSYKRWINDDANALELVMDVSVVIAVVVLVGILVS